MGGGALARDHPCASSMFTHINPTIEETRASGAPPTWTVTLGWLQQVWVVMGLALPPFFRRGLGKFGYGFGFRKGRLRI